MCYQAGIKPLDRQYKNKIELFNENIIAIITFHFIFFTDWIDNELDKFMLGWSAIGWTALLIAGNIIPIFYLAGSQIYLIYTKYKGVLDRYLEKNNMCCKRKTKEKPKKKKFKKKKRIVKIMKKKKKKVSGVKNDGHNFTFNDILE